nr:hypothetical protein [uncultured Flavobacterium sp.]
MSQLKYFTRNGNNYVMKRELGFAILISIGLAAFAVGGIWINNMAMFWIFGVLSIFCIISIWSKQVIIDLKAKEIIVKVGLIGKPVPIPLKDFQNFELIRMKHFFVTINTSLNVNYLKDGKEKSILIAQGFTARAMQNLANELDEILNSNEHS